MTPFREVRASRLADETGTLYKQADLVFALCYPSPYHVGMSSLGFQSIYRILHGLPGCTAERAFLPDDVAEIQRPSEELCTYESGRPVGDFPVVAFSLASELELAGVVTCLDLAGIPALAAERAAHARTFPLVMLGGPLTFSNPVPVGPFADVIVMGEAEELVPILVNSLRDQPDRESLLNELARRPGFYIPSLHGETPPPVAIASDDCQRRLPSRLLANRHAAHRADEHVSHRGRAWVQPRLRLLRDAPVGGIGHASGGARALALAHPGRGAASGTGGRGGH